MNRILVTGTARVWLEPAQRAAELVGLTLARSRFGLVTGNATGVDVWVSKSYCSAARRFGLDVPACFCQIAASYLKRGSYLPLPGFRAASNCRVTVRDFDAWMEEALAKSDAAVLIGGSKGALRIARTFMDAGKPVFPIPFVSGGSDEVFRDLLATWCDSPVPGLTRNQFLSLALPWNRGTGSLENLLFGTLAPSPDIFVCYRRKDGGMAAGRLHADLSEHFGTSRVFMDLHGIEPSVRWQARIEEAIRACKVGVVVIGDRWLDPGQAGGAGRIFDEDDYVRREIRTLIDAGKPIAPVLIGSARLPALEELPDDLRAVRDCQIASLDNANWDVEVRRLVQHFENVIQADSHKVTGPTAYSAQRS